MFYNPSTARTYTFNQIERQTGLDPTITNNEIYIDMGFYPVQENDPTVPDCLYVLTAVYTIVGTEAVQSWSSVAEPLADAKTHGIHCAKKAADTQIKSSFDVSAFNAPLLIAAMSLEPANRGAEFTSFMNPLAAKTGVLQDQITAVNAAVDVDEIVYIVFPSTGITGTLQVTRSGNNLTSATFTSLTGATGADFEFVGESATVQWDAGSSSFPATTGVFNGGTHPFTLRYGGFWDVLTEDSTVDGSPQDFPIDWEPAITPLPLTYNPDA